MKKSKLLIVCLIGLLLAVGIILVGCEKDCGGGCYANESGGSNEYCNNGSCPFYDGKFDNPGDKCPC